MKIRDIISEDTTAAVVASVAMPMTPGTKPADARAAVDPKGYGPNKKRKGKSKHPVYSKVIRRT